jgi:chromosome condensin MukBEF MukE localization factor
VHRQARIHHQHVGRGRHQRDRRQLAERVVVQVARQRRRGHQRAVDGEQQRIAIGGGARHHAGADIAAGAGTVFHHHRLAQRGGQLFGHDARDQVGR